MDKRPAKLELKSSQVTVLSGVETKWFWWVTIDRRRPYSDKLAYASPEAARLGATLWLRENFPAYQLTEE